MTVEIQTHYLGQNRYQILIRQGGVTQMIPATWGTVVAIRNRLCTAWSKVADKVEAGEIPEAWDLRKKGPGI